MKETLRRTQWYWWIPVIGLYFIEEMAGWVHDARYKPIQTKRMAMVYRILLVHILALITLVGYLTNK